MSVVRPSPVAQPAIHGVSTEFARFAEGRVEPDELAHFVRIVERFRSVLEEAKVTPAEVVQVLCWMHTGSRWAFEKLGTVPDDRFTYGMVCNPDPKCPTGYAGRVQHADGPLYVTLINLFRVRQELDAYADAAARGKVVFERGPFPEAPKVVLTLEQRFETLGVEEATHLRAMSGHPKLAPIDGNTRFAENRTLAYALQSHEVDGLRTREKFLRERYGKSPLTGHFLAMMRARDGFVDVGRT